MPGRKVFLFDECWTFFKNILPSASGTFRARCIGGLQNLDDFQKPTRRVIIQNTYFKFFSQNLKQRIVSEHLAAQVAGFIQKGEYSSCSGVENFKASTLYATPWGRAFTSDSKTWITLKTIWRKDDFSNSECPNQLHKNQASNWSHAWKHSYFLFVSSSRAIKFRQDTALLFDLVTTTASQFNELENCHQCGKVHQEDAEYNELVKMNIFAPNGCSILPTNWPPNVTLKIWAT